MDGREHSRSAGLVQCMFVVYTQRTEHCKVVTAAQRARVTVRCKRTSPNAASTPTAVFGLQSKKQVLQFIARDPRVTAIQSVRGPPKPPCIRSERVSNESARQSRTT